MDDFYCLITFARRSAVYALRGNASSLVDGLTAIAIIDPIRVDSRDIVWALGLLRHAAPDKRSARSAFDRAAGLAEPSTARIIRDAGGRRDDLRAWGYADISTAEGAGLIGFGYNRYRPSCDLGQVVLSIADILDGDHYQPDDPAIASSIAPVWLSSPGREEHARPLDARGVAHVGSHLRVPQPNELSWDGIMVWVAELKSEFEAAETGRRAARASSRSFVRHGVVVGRLFALVVSSSAMADRLPIEDSESLLRFVRPIRKILESPGR
jgi:hypothetical protein